LGDASGIKVKECILSVKAIIQDNFKCVQKMWRFLCLEIVWYFADFEGL